MFIFSIATAYHDFAGKLAKQAHLKVGRVEFKKFSDGEIYVRVGESVAQKKVYVVGTTAPPADNLIEMLLLVDALKTAKALHITAIIPYFGYGRADHLVESGEALSAKLMANLLHCAGVRRVVAIDLHSPRVEKFFTMPLVHVRAQELLARTIKAELFNDQSSALTIVAPDHGAIPLAKRMGRLLRARVAWFEKIRPQHNVAQLGALHGDVAGKIAVLVDDMIDTAGTIAEAANQLKQHGAKKIIVAVTHGVLSGPALERLKQTPIDKVIITDTLPNVSQKKFNKLRVVSVIPLLAEKFRRI
ncbi:MAG: Ribose-phosphate pyrophosphokinase [Parcubacteria group bacterium GW2011_GWC2_45_7]|nr:MAG: Ribose-phosphate pyrophosphokinase [Parcubacteria group bacterium GW2011_GWC2_45_7]KKU73844.1 MAG: Ribose-phosphate pyrophosphokinase [Parcubacteria group bacterium GW2011_GWA2_47_26]